MENCVIVFSSEKYNTHLCNHKFNYKKPYKTQNFGDSVYKHLGDKKQFSLLYAVTAYVPMSFNLVIGNLPKNILKRDLRTIAFTGVYFLFLFLEKEIFCILAKMDQLYKKFGR
jgi:hypothetical protein